MDKPYEREMKMPDVFLLLIFALLFSLPVSIGLISLLFGKPIQEIDNPWLFLWIPSIVYSYILGWFRVYLKVGRT